MSKLDNIEVLLLAGYSREQILAQYPNNTPNTIGTYIRRIQSKFTAEQRQRVADARAAMEQAAPHSGYHQKMINKKPLSAEHARIGRKLARMRQEKKLNAEEFTRRYAFSNRVALSGIENGFHDFKLSEIHRISEILDLPVSELLSPAKGIMAA